ncbi:5-formyltetrahydrofolate cyclo-ligase [Lacticigenium naphthae]|uniref:5-formyltetrahydrofolate cyclo-ligase n=1 Tax=Lacticigenium naphthae TaxID=515351 RepID=UPI0004181870|nr:5-formyltetrahydrofolate cyclo-ligase [Lacticigenium naphthae]
MKKNECRKQMMKRLTSMTREEREEIETSIHRNLFSSSLWKNAKVIGVTISNNGEWDTHRIIRQGWIEGKKVAVPKTVPQSKKLEFYLIEDFSQTEKGFYQLIEPLPEKTEKISKQNIDLLIVPGVIYNSSGYRIGFGGGYYDRFLMDFPQTTVSLLSVHQLNEKIPIEAHDIPVDYLILEERILSVHECD